MAEKRLSPEERAKRDARIFSLFVAGTSEREIGRIVGLSGQRVHQIIQKELKEGSRHRQLLTDSALAVYTTRLEVLIRAVWPKVVQGDLKAVEVARRLMESQSRLYNLEEERVGAIPPISEQDLLGDAPPEVDELSAFRARHRGGSSTSNELPEEQQLEDPDSEAT